MSIDFSATFALGAAFAGPAWLRDALAADTDAIAQVANQYRQYWRAKEWALEDRPNVHWNLIGPGGFVLELSPKALNLYHMVRFFSFAADEETRGPIRRACLKIADLVGSPRAVYKHELYPDGFSDGKDLDGVEAHLRSQFGPPAPTFAALAEAGRTNDYAPGYWYIDTFADLRG
jgi:hypothetical protein